jgi:hypothetical protein
MQIFCERAGRSDAGLLEGVFVRGGWGWAKLFGLCGME